MPAVLFAGQGAQFPGMGRSLLQQFRQASLIFEEASDAISLDLRTLALEGPEDKMQQTAVTQPLMLAFGLAGWAALCDAWEITADAAAGHSLGEWSALVSQGAIQLAPAIAAVHRRGTCMQNAVPVGQGSMAAMLGAEDKDVETLCTAATTATGIGVWCANYNMPGQIVVSGATPAVDWAIEHAAAHNVRRAVPLPVSAPFHSPMMEPAQQEFATTLDEIQISAPLRPVYRNVDGQPHSTHPEEIRQSLLQQIAAPVQFVAEIQAMQDRDCDTYVEIAPRPTLAPMVRKILNRNTPVCSIGSWEDLQQKPDWLA